MNSPDDLNVGQWCILALVLCAVLLMVEFWFMRDDDGTDDDE